MKKILLFAAVAFIIVSILAIMFTFQASSTFRNFTDDNGDNGDDHINPSNINQFLDNHIDKREGSYIRIKDQYIIANCRNLIVKKVNLQFELFLPHKHRNIYLFHL